MSERGQAFTLEAITASLLLIGGLVFALQATAVTPLSASTSSQHIENQQQAVAEGVLANAVADEELSIAVRYWDETNVEFHGAGDESYYIDQTIPTDFGTLLDHAFGSRSIVANVYVHHETGAETIRTQRVVYHGAPSDNAVSTSATIALYDDDELLDSNERPTGTTLSGTSDFYADDAYPSSGLYNVVEVEVVVWRQ
ncbi:hypothetical protein [Halosegnis sp.]|uniref:DUF7288 family protein n=1 Tax=Halosegnis sp. TaxID=2864959 RepID=UPI0035D4AEE4